MVVENKKEEAPKKAKSQGPWYWLSDTRGQKSITATLVFVSFWVTTLAFLSSTVEKAAGFEFRSFDVAACSAYFVPILTLYFGRKWTDAKLSAKTLSSAETPKEG